jgi:hypothetical protein
VICWILCNLAVRLDQSLHSSSPPPPTSAAPATSNALYCRLWKGRECSSGLNDLCSGQPTSSAAWKAVASLGDILVSAVGSARRDLDSCAAARHRSRYRCLNRAWLNPNTKGICECSFLLCESDNLIPELPTLHKYSCVQHGPVATWFRSARHGQAILYLIQKHLLCWE